VGLFVAAYGAFVLNAISMPQKKTIVLYVLISMVTQINSEGNCGGTNSKYIYMGEIRIGDIVFHQLSKLLFKCENKKHERWMSMNPFYQKTDLKEINYEISFRIIS
jgi:hypothetical protein